MNNDPTEIPFVSLFNPDGSLTPHGQLSALAALKTTLDRVVRGQGSSHDKSTIALMVRSDGNHKVDTAIHVTSDVLHKHQYELAEWMKNNPELNEGVVNVDAFLR